MPKIVTIHQPNYLPWIGFFSKISHSDCLIIGDTYLLGGQSVLNRNKIRTRSGWSYLTIPIGHKSEGTRISDLSLPAKNEWQKVHWKMIHDNYANAAYFNLYKSELEKLYHEQYRRICQLNENLIQYLLDCFNIKIEILKASDLGIDPRLEKTDLMIALLKKAGADIYLSGPSGRIYLEIVKFGQNYIDLKYFNFQHPVYPQRYPGFEPNMSSIDLLFNTGPMASRIMQNSGNIADS